MVISIILHLPDLSQKPQKEEEVIQEIQEVLARNSKDLSNETQRELAKLIYAESLRYNHDPKFILALIAIESSFQNRSVSEKGAKGLMQLMPEVAESIAKDLGIEWKGDLTLFNPYLNIRMGIYYFSQLVSDFNDIRVALTAYNYGPTYIKELVDNRKKIPINFTQRVFTVYQTL
jgi:soluble lytic murein transglycosylase